MKKLLKLLPLCASVLVCDAYATTAYYLGSCDYLKTKVSSNPSSEPLYNLGVFANQVCGSTGQYSSAWCTADKLSVARLVLTSLTGAKYCGASNWYYSTTTGNGVFCFNSQSECQKMLGKSCLNNPANDATKAQGIQLTSSDATAISGGTTAKSVTTQNDAWFACCASCAATSTDWTTMGNKRYKIAGQACDSTGACNSIGGNTVQCLQNYYAVGGVGTVTTTGNPSGAITCELCPYVGNDSGGRGVTSGPGSVIGDCVAQQNVSYTDTHGSFTVTTDACNYGIDCSSVTPVCRNVAGTSGIVYEEPLGEAVSGASQACWCSVTDSAQGITKWWFSTTIGPNANSSQGSCTGTCPRVCSQGVPRARLGCL